MLHFTYNRFSDLKSRRDRCDCAPTDEDAKRCFILPFDRMVRQPPAPPALAPMHSDGEAFSAEYLTAADPARHFPQSIQRQQIQPSVAGLPGCINEDGR